MSRLELEPNLCHYLEEFLGLSASIPFLHNVYHWVNKPPNPVGVLAYCEWL